MVAVRLNLDTSGKSPAYLHYRKKFGARAGKLAAGFLLEFFLIGRRLAHEALHPPDALLQVASQVSCRPNIVYLRTTSVWEFE